MTFTDDKGRVSPRNRSEQLGWLYCTNSQKQYILWLHLTEVQCEAHQDNRRERKWNRA